MKELAWKNSGITELVSVIFLYVAITHIGQGTSNLQDTIVANVAESYQQSLGKLNSLLQRTYEFSGGLF